MTDLKYRPDIDGLRAIAVSFVLLFHANLACSGGFIGVDVFFVISGFLITGLILKEQQTGSFRLSSFWLRRVRRILPMSLIVAFTTLIAGFYLLLPSDYEELSKSAVAQQLMLSNVFFWRNNGYFSGAADLKPLLHTWSLAVEEQFYLAYPFLLVVLRKFSQRVTVTSLLTVALGSLVASEYAIADHPFATFYLLPTRAWELILGGLLCFVPSEAIFRRWSCEAMSALGLLGICIPAFCFDKGTRFPGAAALLPCLGTAFVIHANRSMLTWTGRMLAARPLVFVGLLSYSLYLWHWPILSLMRHVLTEVYVTEPTRLSQVTGIAIAAVLAYSSWRFIENPVRKKTLLFDSRRLLGVMSLAIGCLIIGCVSVIQLDGLPGRFNPRVIVYASATTSFNNQVAVEDIERSTAPTFGVHGGKTKCVVWGDSHAMVLMSGITAAAKTQDVEVYQATRWATVPLLGFDHESIWSNTDGTAFCESVARFAVSKDADIVILAAMWSKYADSPTFERSMAQTIDELTRHGIRVAIVRDVAVQVGDVPKILAAAVRRNRSVEQIGVYLEEHRQRNSVCDGVLLRVASENVTVLDPAETFVDESGLWRAELDGVSMYGDADHLSDEGGLRLQSMFETLFVCLNAKQSDKVRTN